MKVMLYTSVAALTLLHAGQSLAQDAQPAAAAGANETTEVVIYGHGQSRQTETVKAQDITLSAPGTSPMKVINKLPGVNFQSADPFGAYEWSTYMTIRGFSQNQMGFTLDGITLGDMSYGNYNGLHISRAIINEDIARADLAQGAGALETASSSNLGGTLVFTSRDPSHEMGGELAGTLGTEAMHRAYGRFETGDIQALGGLRGYISAVDQKTDKWKGGGEQRAQQIDTKWVLPVGEGSVTGFVNHSERREQDYQDMSLSMIQRYGDDFDNFQPDYAKAIGVATVLNTPAYYLSGQLDPSSGYWTGVGTNPYAQYGVQNPDEAYYYGAGVRNDTLSGLSFKAPVSDHLKFNGTLYHHDDKGQGLWVSPYNPSPNYGVAGATTDNAPLSVRTTEYKINRTGVLLNGEFDIGSHVITGGLWFEDNKFNQARRYYGENLDAPYRDSLGFQSNPYRTAWEYAFDTKTSEGYLQDVWTLSPAVKINYGFKALNVENNVHTIVGSAMEAKIRSSDGFLPQVGLVYTMNRGNELFASYSENMDAYTSAATSGPFAAQSQTVVDYIKDHLKPESSKTIEGGWRFRADRLQGVLALYHVDFQNRILAVQQGPAIVGNAPILSNVGSVATNGLELAGTFRITQAWKLYAAYSYNDSQYKDDVTDANGNILANTRDKTVVNSPKNMVKTELSYDNGGFFGTLSANYLGKRYYTYTNNGGEVDASTVADLTAGYHFTKAMVDVQLNVTNLFDTSYISTIGEAGFVNSDPNGTTQTVMPGAPREIFVTVRKSF